MENKEFLKKYVRNPKSTFENVYYTRVLEGWQEIVDIEHKLKRLKLVIILMNNFKYVAIYGK